MHAAVRQLDMEAYDLVFVDDSTCARDRAHTIQEVARRCSPSNRVAIHDYELPLYRAAAKMIPHRFRFTALRPNTGLAWNEVTLRRRVLARVNRLIRHYLPETAPADVDSWVRIMDANL
jgi:hypothetical protein